MMDKIEPGISPNLNVLIEALRSLPKIEKVIIPTIDLSGLAKVQRDALAVFPVLQQGIAEQMRSFTEVQQCLRNILPPPSAFQEMAGTLARLRLQFEQLSKPSPEHLRIFAQIAVVEARQRRLDRIGVLPHQSTPFDILDDQSTDEELKGRIQLYYKDNWIAIHQVMRNRTQEFDIDDEARATFTEALEAHHNAHYRAVCRLLLSEIERVARVELQGSGLGKLRIEKILGEPAGSLSLGDTEPPGLYALGLYKRLTEHLYRRVDATNRAQFESDPVPNRHAAIHGLIVYNSFWHSLNAIFLTDYAFQVVTAIKLMRRKESTPQ
jgi:hypothetical protein